MSGPRFRLPPRRVGVAVKSSNPDAVELGKRILEELSRRGVAGVVDRDSAPSLGAPAGPDRALLGQDVDAIIVLGGDGTFLSVTRGCPPSTPVAGINLGTLGFLTEHSPEAALSLVSSLLSGDVTIEQRHRLEVRVSGVGEEQRFLVLNDAVVNKAALARVVTIYVEVDGEFLSRYRGDGLILATPAGSTAYNLSAGGPIVHPALPALLITPICSHSLGVRPLAVPLDCRASVWIDEGDAEVYLTLDGQVGLPMQAGMKVTATASNQPLSVIRDPESGFFSILHQKLKWGEREG